MVHTARGGASFARFLVAVSAFFLIPGYSRIRKSLPGISARLPSSPFSWPWLGAHAVTLVLFLALSLSGHAILQLSFQADLALWYASGLGAIALLILAFIPPVAVRELLLKTGRAWLYALAGGVAAWRLVPLFQSLWNGARGQSLTDLTFSFVHFLLKSTIPGVIADRANLTIGTARFTVKIGDACSGFEGLGMILIFGLMWLLFFRREIRFPQAFLTLPVGLLVMWLLNAGRIALLVAIGHFGADKVALGGFHSQAGWISFSAVTIAYAGALRHFRWFAKTDPRPVATENRTAAFLVPFMAIMAASLLTHAASSGFEWLYPLRFFAAAGALWFLRKSYRTLDWGVSWIGPATGVAVLIVWLALERLQSGAPMAMPMALRDASGAARAIWIPIRILAAVVSVPIAEELAFRGFLLRRLALGKNGAEDFEAVPWMRLNWPALFLSSIAFGALHGSRWPGGTLAGLLYGLAVARKGKFGDAVAAHATTNAILAAYVLSYNQWQLW